jgi:hypothetical protein
MRMTTGESDLVSFASGGICALGGGTVVHAVGQGVRVIRDRAEIARFEVDAAVGFLRVAPDGRRALIYDARSTRVWLWRESHGLSLLATATSSRNAFGCGFLAVNGEVLTMLAEGGVLYGLADDGRQRLNANIESSHAFYPQSFVQLSGGRVALVGAFFGDYANVAVTLEADRLLSDRDAVQQAIEDKRPVWDRAVDLTVGPCGPGCAVVLRNPEDTEIPEDEEELEDLGDVGNFTGIYVRNLDTGTLVERIPYRGGAGRGVPIAATEEWIAVEVAGGIDLIPRGPGAVRQIREEAAIDAVAIEAAILHEGGGIEIVPLPTLVGN